MPANCVQQLFAVSASCRHKRWESELQRVFGECPGGKLAVCWILATLERCAEGHRSSEPSSHRRFQRGIARAPLSQQGSGDENASITAIARRDRRRESEQLSRDIARVFDLLPDKHIGLGEP